MCITTTTPTVGALADHKYGDLDPREVTRVTSRGIWLLGSGGESFGPLDPAKYTFTREATEAEETLHALRELLPVGATLHTIERHVSSSGMSRSISVIYVDKDGGVHDLDWLVFRAGVGTFDQRHRGIKMAGAGMDMAFALVYNIGRALYPDGVPCTGRNRDTATRNVAVCHSNDHSNEREAFYSRKRKHSDGGYAFWKSSL